ncbi:MAG: SMP-30/gluconolactonase/LRE family protein [Bauldia sp.]
MEREIPRRLISSLAFLLAMAAGGAFAADQLTRFSVPRGSHPHDVAPGANGMVWYTAQTSGKLGIVDPKTGEVNEVPLGRGSAPHGVIPGPDGAAWITDGGQNAIVRYDPKDGSVKVWPLPPEGANANLNTAAFDKAGTLWFTGQNGIYGRLVPATGKVEVFKAPKGRGPYGIAATPQGRVFYVSLAGSYLAEIDTASGAAKVIEPPTKDQGARRVWSDSAGNLWISEWNAGKIGRYAPDTGAWKEWPLPGASASAYAIFVDSRDIVWVSDFVSQAVLSFDPKSEKFTAFPNSARNGDVRQIHGRPGEVLYAESGTEKIVVIRTGN